MPAEIIRWLVATGDKRAVWLDAAALALMLMMPNGNRCGVLARFCVSCGRQVNHGMAHRCDRSIAEPAPNGEAGAAVTSHAPTNARALAAAHAEVLQLRARVDALSAQLANGGGKGNYRLR